MGKLQILPEASESRINEDVCNYEIITLIEGQSNILGSSQNILSFFKTFHLCDHRKHHGPRQGCSDQCRHHCNQCHHHGHKAIKYDTTIILATTTTISSTITIYHFTSPSHIILHLSGIDGYSTSFMGITFECGDIFEVSSICVS